MTLSRTSRESLILSVPIIEVSYRSSLFSCNIVVHFTSALNAPFTSIAKCIGIVFTFIAKESTERVLPTDSLITYTVRWHPSRDPINRFFVADVQVVIFKKKKNLNIPTSSVPI